MVKPAIIIHGGLRIRKPERIESDKERYRDLREALITGYETLLKNSSLEAVLEAVVYMEDSPNFNAGKGSYLNLKGEIEMDAAIMDGRNLKFGAVASVKNCVNPVKLAKYIMENTKHSLICGRGAEEIAKRAGLYGEVKPTNKSIEIYNALLKKYSETREIHTSIKGTVGAVAVDSKGNIAAATSTGGLCLKLPGRIGDTPLPGCGTYADNRGGACSGTGIGEAAIRHCTAKTVVDKMRNGLSAMEACDKTIKELYKLTKLEYGVVSVRKNGDIGYSMIGYQMYMAFYWKGKSRVGSLMKTGFKTF